MERGNSAPPALLYKYCSPHLTRVFDTCSVRFSQLSALNDPCEFLVGIDQSALLRSLAQMGVEKVREEFAPQNVKVRIETELLRRVPQFAALPKHQKNKLISEMQIKAATLLPDVDDLSTAIAGKMTQTLKEKIDEVQQGDLLVFCCAENSASIPMWAHYAGNHQGFQIAFDPKQFLQKLTPKGERISPRRVSYADLMPTISSVDSFPDFVATKFSDWSYEREWRYFAFKSDADGEPEPDVYLFKFDPIAIKNVTFGLKCEQKTIDEVRSKLSDIAPHCLLERISLKGDGYGLGAAPLSL